MNLIERVLEAGVYVLAYGLIGAIAALTGRWLMAFSEQKPQGWRRPLGIAAIVAFGAVLWHLRDVVHTVLPATQD